jgi:hypothetical protein
VEESRLRHAFLLPGGNVGIEHVPGLGRQYAGALLGRDAGSPLAASTLFASRTTVPLARRPASAGKQLPRPDLAAQNAGADGVDELTV